MGSEMCIRDSRIAGHQDHGHGEVGQRPIGQPLDIEELMSPQGDPCLLYTSDAAAERSRVDLGGRRIIKKKRKKNEKGSRQ